MAGTADSDSQTVVFRQHQTLERHLLFRVFFSHRKVPLYENQ